MRFLFIFIFLLGSIFNTISAQQPFFQKSQGSDLNDVALGIAPVGNNGFMFVGNTYTSNYDSSFVRLARVDSSLNLKWEKQLNLHRITQVTSISHTPNGEFVMSGYTRANNSAILEQGSWFMRFDSLGHRLWHRNLLAPRTEGKHVFAKADGTVIGLVHHTDSGGSVVRFDATGTFQNAFSMSIDNTVAINMVASSAAQVNQDVLMVAGGSSGFYDRINLLNLNVANLTPSTNWAFSYTIPNYNSLSLKTIQADNQGNIYVLGRGSSNGIAERLILFKVNPQGDLVWAKSIQSQTNLYNSPRGLMLSNNQVVVLGSAGEYATMCYFDTSGNVTRAKRVGSQYNSVMMAGQSNLYQGYDIFGMSSIGQSNTSFYWWRTDPLGNSGSCYTDTFAVIINPITLSRTSLNINFSATSLATNTDTLPQQFTYPLSNSITCGRPACTAPTIPTLLVGNTICANAAGFDTIPILRWTRTADRYKIKVFELNSNIPIWSASCVTDTFIRPSFNWRLGGYKWQVQALTGTCQNITCESDTSSSAYFYGRFPIYNKDTAYNCVGSNVTLDPNTFVTMTWYRGDTIVEYSSYHTTSIPGTYRAVLAQRTNDNACPQITIQSKPVVIYTRDYFPFSISPSATTFCPGQTIRLVASGSPSRYYRWSSDRLYANIDRIGDSIATVHFPNTASGNYLFFISSTYLECSQTKRLELSISPTTTPSVSIATTSGCPTRNLTLTASANGEGSQPKFWWYRVGDTTNIVDTNRIFTYNNAQNNDKFICKMRIGEGVCTTTPIVWSDTLTINCISNATNDIDGLKKFAIYPNPTHDQINVSVILAKPFTEGVLILRNVLGQVIKRKTFNNLELNELLNLSELPKGIYFLSLSVDKQVVTQKITIE